MKILAVSDEECAALWDHYTPGRLKEYDLILSCGDLKSEYLSFLVTMARCPVLYVHGNHDGDYQLRPPEGCDCIDDALVVYNGIRILGLGGSMRYKEGPHMYTEGQMYRRVLTAGMKSTFTNGFDILLTHAPARGWRDLEDLPHRGFECFNTLIEKYEPSYFIHGHVHRNYGVRIPQITQKGKTTVVNAYEYCVIEI